MIKWLQGIIDRIFVLAGALVLSQAPLFMQHYTTQLAGHAEELQFQVLKLEAAAAVSNKSLAVYIQKFVLSQDEDFARQGQLIQDIVDRSLSFRLALSDLQQATILNKPFAFIAHFNTEVAKASWKSFEFGLAFSWEGLVYALIGAFVGYMFFALIARFFIWLGTLFSFNKVESAT